MKRKTNAQFVKQVMETGSPLNQIFVIECLDKWSKYILENQDAVRESMKNHMVYPESWIGCARHVQNHILARDEQFKKA